MATAAMAGDVNLLENMECEERRLSRMEPWLGLKSRTLRKNERLASDIRGTLQITDSKV